jgi:hypothetical protein
LATVTRSLVAGFLRPDVSLQQTPRTARKADWVDLWGYRENLKPHSKLCGALLALTLQKPQLGIVPVGYAIFKWLAVLREEKRLPAQMISFVVASLAIYIPSFIIFPI